MRAVRTIAMVNALGVAGLGLVGLGLVGVTMKTSNAQESPPPIIERSSVHPARTLDVADLAGRLTVDVEDRGDIAVLLKGPESAVEAVRIDARNGVLHLSGGADPESSTTVIHMDNVTTVVTGGGSARVTIGGREASVNRPPRPPLFVTVRVPRATPVTVAPAIDSVTIADTQGPLRLVIATATVRAGAVGPADIALNGSGDVRLGRVSGDLSVAIQGSGNVTVDDGTVGTLAVAIRGTGDVSIGGRADTADLSLAGAGRIRVQEVVHRPRSTVNGAGSITVGNW